MSQLALSFPAPLAYGLLPVVGYDRWVRPARWWWYVLLRTPRWEQVQANGTATSEFEARQAAEAARSALGGAT